MRQLLKNGHAMCPKQACSDLILLLHEKEQSETIRELDEATAFSISSDGTINVAEALAVVRPVNCTLTLHFKLIHDASNAHELSPSNNRSLNLQIIRFVCKKKTIQQRVLALNFLESPLAGNTLAAQLIKQVMTPAHQNPLKLRFNTADGCATNGVANEVMKAVFSECCDLILWSAY